VHSKLNPKKHEMKSIIIKSVLALNNQLKVFKSLNVCSPTYTPVQLTWPTERTNIIVQICHVWWHSIACHYELSLMMTHHIMPSRTVTHDDTPRHAITNCHSWWHTTSCQHELSSMTTHCSMSSRIVIYDDIV